ncbi:MAG: archaeal proteasome endopeptidase complex subunit alpha [Candidatus Geothermarchaeales archaeon]
MFVPQSGYDRAITVFSPDGRLFQVEYANETVRRGTLSMGLATKEGILLVAEEHVDKFQDEEFSRKLFILDDHVGVAVAGYVPDGRILVDYAREYCQTHRLIYDERISTELVARRIGDIKQSFTQQAGVRPFGVSIIFGGVDTNKESKIFVTDPSGSYMRYFVAVIGNRSEAALNFISEKYRDDFNFDEAKTLTAAAIQRSTLTPEELKIRFLEVPADTAKAKLESIAESSKYLEKAREAFGE